MSRELLIGMMSGTSVDGIDAVLVEFESTKQLRVIESHFTPFDRTLVQQINQLAQSSRLQQPSDYADLHLELARIYADASLELINKSGVNKTAISAIANHGQTIAHEPTAKPPFSIQIGDAQLIANLTGLTTVSQFRQADLAVGGQGAPLMPAFHQTLFSNPGIGELNSGLNTYILNLGGIANITALDNSVIGNSVIGFDTGPANTLLNQWISHCQQQAFDHNGQWAATGKTIPTVLDQLVADPYFALAYPKSTGPDYFNLSWLTKVVDQLEQYSARDIQATLLEFSVETIAMGFALMKVNHGRLYVCGGGVHNQTLMQGLASRLEGFELKLSDELGVPADWVEATGFAWLGYCQLHGVPSNLPSVTGASRQVVLGKRFEPL